MMDRKEAKAAAQALYFQSAALSGLEVSKESPEKLGDIIEHNFNRVNAERRPEAVAHLLRVIAGALESAQEAKIGTLRESDVQAGRDKVCPVFPFD